MNRPQNPATILPSKNKPYDPEADRKQLADHLATLPKDKLAKYKKLLAEYLPIAKERVKALEEQYEFECTGLLLSMNSQSLQHNNMSWVILGQANYRDFKVMVQINHLIGIMNAGIEREINDAFKNSRTYRKANPLFFKPKEDSNPKMCPLVALTKLCKAVDKGLQINTPDQRMYFNIVMQAIAHKRRQIFGNGNVYPLDVLFKKFEVEMALKATIESNQ